MKKTILTFFCFIIFLFGQAQIIDPVYISKTINVPTAGTLSTLISDNDINKITKLTISGNIDARDINFLYFIINLSVLDMSDVNIKEYNGIGGLYPNRYSETLYPANEIPSYSFVYFDYNSALTTILLPKSLTSIAKYAFYNCWGLRDITMPDSLVSIGENAFYCCLCLFTINIPKEVTTIASDAFSYCINTTTFNVNTENRHFCSQDGIIYNKDMSILYAYPKAREGSFIVPATVTSIGKYAFDHCSNLIDIVIPNSVSEIGEMAFNSCTNLQSINLPKKIKKIKDNTFQFCSYLKSVNMPDSLQFIGINAFCLCENLRDIEIPKTVSYIGNSAFEQCNKLSIIYALNTDPIDLSLTANVFSFDKANCILYVPKGSEIAYRQANQWKDFKFVKEIIAGIRLIGLSDIKILTDNEKLIIENAKLRDKVEIFSITGIKIKEQLIDSYQTKIKLHSGIYLIRIDNYSCKVIVK